MKARRNHTPLYHTSRVHSEVKLHRKPKRFRKEEKQRLTDYTGNLNPRLE